MPWGAPTFLGTVSNEGLPNLSSCQEKLRRQKKKWTKKCHFLFLLLHSVFCFFSLTCKGTGHHISLLNRILEEYPFLTVPYEIGASRARQMHLGASLF